jgi:hypothetical protein
MPGTPAGTTTTTPALEASGEQANRTIEVYTVRGGNPGAAVGLIADNYPAGPAQAWRYSGDTLYRGCDAPDTISEFEFLTRSTVGAAWLDPHAVARPDGRAFQVWQESERYVSVWTRPNGGAWAATATRPYDAGSAVYASPIAACPCLVTLPGNRLLCLFYRYHATTPGIVSCSSDDNGATWTAPQLVDGILSALSPIRPIRIRAAYGNGQISMFVWIQGATDSVIQFASIDGGNSFVMVTLTVADTDCGYPEVVAIPGGGFVLATIESDRPTTGLPTPPRTAIAYARRFSSAFDLALAVTPVCLQSDASTREWGVVTGAVLTAGELAMTVDAAGVIWVVGVNFSAAGLRSAATCSSADGGATWVFGPSSWWKGGDASTHPKRLALCAQGARLVVPHNHAAAPATAQDSAAVLYLGGPTTVPQPQAVTAATLSSLARGYTVTWAPYDLPENVAATWTFGSVGAPTISLTGQGVRIQHGGALDSADWTATPTTTNAQGLIALFDFKTDALNSSVYGMLRIGAAGPSSYEARVEVTPTTIILRDITGAANIATVNTTAGASGVQIKITIGDTAAGAASGKVQAWYRAWGSNSDREFILIGASTALVQGASITDRIMFGSLAGAAAGDVYVRLVQYAQGTDCGVGLYDAANTTTAKLLGQPIGPAPYPLAETGLRLAGRAGPLVPGHAWTIAPRYAHGVENIDPATSPSPAATWRSTADNVSQRIVFTMAEATTIEQFLASLYIDGANIPGIDFDAWNGAAWVTIAALDLRIGTALRYARAGEIVRCNDTGAGGIANYIDRGALRNCTWSTGAGGVRRRIRTNTGGRWVTSAAFTTTRPTVILDSFVVGDPAAGAAGEIWSPRGCAVFRGAATAYSRYSLHIAAQTTAEGYYEIGIGMVGGLTVIGAPDTSRQLASETNTETVKARNGSRSKRRLGPPPRVAQIAWSDGLDTSNIHDTSPDYVTDYQGGYPISAPAGIAGDITAIVEENDATPIVYLPVVPVPAAAATVTSITARSLMLYADITSDVIQTDVAAGDEHVGAGAGEYVRVSTVRIEEVL